MQKTGVFLQSISRILSALSIRLLQSGGHGTVCVVCSTGVPPPPSHPFLQNTNIHFCLLLLSPPPATILIHTQKKCFVWDLNPGPLAHKTNAITNLANKAYLNVGNDNILIVYRVNTMHGLIPFVAA